jgi:hypothetical protein
MHRKPKANTGKILYSNNSHSCSYIYGHTHTRVDQKILRILLPSQNRFRQEFENGVRLWGKGSRTLG